MDTKALIRGECGNGVQKGFFMDKNERRVGTVSRGYLAIKNNEIVGIFALLLTKDDTYDVIDGKWLNDEKYITIHKIAVKYHKQHIASDILNFVIDLANKKSINNIRIDTSSLNKSMTTFLLKNNFKHCGVISITKNFNDLKSLRDAYQKELS